MQLVSMFTHKFRVGSDFITLQLNIQKQDAWLLALVVSFEFVKCCFIIFG